MNEKLDYIEQAAKENMAFQIDCMDQLNREANTAVAFSLAGMGGAFAFAVDQLGGGSTGLFVALFLAAVYLAVLAGCIIEKCLKAADTMPPANEPGNLLHTPADLSLDDVRRFELDNFQQRIAFNRERNERVAVALNRCRQGMCLTPAIFLVVWGLAWLVWG